MLREVVADESISPGIFADFDEPFRRLQAALSSADVTQIQTHACVLGLYPTVVHQAKKAETVARDIQGRGTIEDFGVICNFGVDIVVVSIDS